MAELTSGHSGLARLLAAGPCEHRTPTRPQYQQIAGNLSFNFDERAFRLSIVVTSLLYATASSVQ